jgi:flavorubredoxin
MKEKMSWRSIIEISRNVYWVGVKDWSRRIFDALIPLPKGTSYNAYLIIGENMKALIDTVNPGFERELEEKNQSNNRSKRHRPYSYESC